MNPTYAGEKTLLNVLIEFMDRHPEGVTLEEMAKEVRRKRPQSRKQSIPPALTYLKQLGLVENEPVRWKTKR